MRRLSIRPFGLLAWILPLPVFSFCSWIMARPPANAAYDLWVWASASMHDSLALTGPLLLTWSAALSAWATGRAWIFNFVPPPIRFRQFVRIGGLTAILGVLAHLGGFAPRILFAARTATFGHLYVASAVTSLSWILIFCALGAVFGHVLSHGRWLVPLPIIVAGPLFLAPLYDRAWAILSPNKQWRPDAGTVPSWSVTVMVVALAVVLILSCLLTVGRMAGHSVEVAGRSYVLPGLGLVVAIVGGLSLLLAAFASRPEIYVSGSQAQPICRTTRSTKVCLHPAHRDSFDVVLASVDQLQELGMGGYVTSVLDSSLQRQSLAEPRKTLTLGVDPSKTTADLTRASIFDLLLSSCREPQAPISENDTTSFTIAYSLASDILRRIGDLGSGPQSGTVPERLRGLSRSDLVAVMRRNQGAALTCSLRLDDLQS